VWPLVVLAVLTLAKRSGRGIEALLGVSAVGVIASAVTMAVRYHPGANITRLYFGTDTHAQSILVGATLACVLTLIQRRRGEVGMAPEARSTRARTVLFVLGLVGLAGTLVLTYSMTGTEAFDYRGGFLLSALSAAAIVTSVVTVPRSLLGRFLSLRLMVWMGTVSYGAYLWHYPVFIEVNAARTGLHGLALLSARIAATFALAGASWYLVERPVMEGRFWRSVQAIGPAVVAIGVTVAVVVIATLATDVAAAPVQTGQLPQAERQALETDGAFGSHPVRFLLVGDSLALTMGLGLVQGSVANFGVHVANKGVLGCDLDNVPSVTSGTVDVPVSDCRHWPALWAHDVATTKPEVAGVLAGRWAITDHVIGGSPSGSGGTRVSIDQPAWRRHLTEQLNQVVDVLSAQGAKVVLFTMPYIEPTNEAPDGSTWPENSPARVDAYNALVRQVAGARPDTVTVIDLNHILGPEGHYTRTVDGVTVRWADGIHISKEGGRWLEGPILPTVGQRGLDVRAGSPG
jgi:peptidoglycan/LPS O-acetylase OafA/YrhL